MNAPVIWILLPLAAAFLIWFVRSSNLQAWLAGCISLALALLAWMLPLDTVLTLGSLSLKVATTLDVLGRRFLLANADMPLLAIIYATTAAWLVVSDAAGTARRLAPVGLAVTALLVAAQAVEPFLYASLLIELAILLTIPLLMIKGKPAGRGLLRFLILQTLALPFILFSGWLLAGIEASPSDLVLVQQTAILLGLGFTLLLSIFPFSSWIPMLAEETQVYKAGFIFWLLPTSALLFGLGFMDHYAWIREAPELAVILQAIGAVMIVSGGVWAAFQRHLGRLLGFSVMAEIGLSLLALSLGNQAGIELFILMLIPRSLGLALWAFSISALETVQPSLRFSAVKGMARTHPLASAGIVLASLSLTGFPLLAGFPVRQALWAQLAAQSPAIAALLLAGTLGLVAGAVRTLAVLVAAPGRTTWETRETLPQRITLGLGLGILFLMGSFPQWTAPLLARLPGLFEHLGR